MTANPEMIDIQKLHELHSKLGDGEIILDVRTPEEFAEGHVPGAKNIPHDQVGNHLDELKKYKKIYMHCKAGGRAQTAFMELKSKGLNNLVCVSVGGMADWQAKGYPTQK